MLTSDISEKTLLDEVTGRDGYTSKFLLLECRIEKRIQNQQLRDNGGRHSVVSAGNSEGSIQGRRKLKSGTTEFKRFSGDIKEWWSFSANLKKCMEIMTLMQTTKFNI